MGWCFSFDNTKKEEVDRLLSFHDNLLDHSLVGNDLWVLFDYFGTRHITLYMIGYNRSTRGYGYKGVDVTCGPLKYTCPARLVDKMSPLTDENDQNGWGREWLKSWHEYRTTKHTKHKWKVGDVVEWWNGQVFTLEEKRGRWWYTNEYKKTTTAKLNKNGKKVS